MLLIYNILKILALITFFLPAFFIPYLNIAVFYVFSISLFFINLFFNKKFKNILYLLYKKTPFKYLIHFAVWIAISGAILVILGRYQIGIYLFYFIWTVGVVFLLSYLFPILTFKNNIKQLIKVLAFANLFTYIIGIIQFIGAKYSINLINSSIHFFANGIYSNPLNEIVENRMYGIFQEPGWFGFFIFINLPFLIMLFKSKYKIINNSLVNFVLNKTLLPLAILCLIMTRSPIWLIFNSLLMFYFIRKTMNKKTFITVFIFIIITLICFSITVHQYNFDNVIMRRISATLSSISSLQSLVQNEPSLASRVISYYATYKVFCNNWLLGVGLGCTKYKIVSILNSAHIPLTYELQLNLLNANTKGMKHAGAFLWSLLSETGIFGAFYFYYFVYKTIKFNDNLKKYLSGIEYEFSSAYTISIIGFVCISCYDVGYTRIIAWFYLGIISIIYLNVYTKKKGIKLNNEDSKRL